MLITPTPSSLFTTMLTQGQPFAFSRWGDGEWQCVMGRVTGHNCDHNAYTPQLTAALRDVLERKPPYMLGINHLSLKLWQRQIDNYVKGVGLYNRTWYDMDVFHRAIMHTEQFADWRAFLAACRQRPVVLVGPAYMRPVVTEMIGVREFVQTPAKDSIKVMGQLVADTKAALARCGPTALVSISCGMAAEVLLDRIYEPDRYAILDMGSVWDPFCGIIHRGYARTRAAEPGWVWPR